MNKLYNQDTICAISTAEGKGAIGLVRLSGNRSLEIARTLFKGKDVTQQKSHTAHFGYWMSDETHQSMIDEVVVTIFKEGKSFTGEDTVEIAAHGSPYILKEILQSCIQAGARLAGPGEFTQRAFFNGRMDLSQAEAVADLIASESKAAHDIALRQMRGGISSELAILREQLINFTALIELELDFSDEDVEFADRTQLNELVQSLKTKIRSLIHSFEYGNAIKNGVPVAIIGKPNAGKSTLLNALLKEDRAIVSDIAGTTRDVIEETVTIDGITFRFIDTAGIRDTEDIIEAIGVEKAKEKVQLAKVVLHLYENDTELLMELQDSLQDKIVFNLRSKIDKTEGYDQNLELELASKYPDYHHFGISVQSNYNIEKLIQALVSQFQNEHQDSSVVITNVRHKDALEKSLEALEEVESGMRYQLSGDLLALHLKDALYHLGTITGKIDVDKDILGAIFGKFCIGK